MENLLIKKRVAYCWDPKYQRYMKMGIVSFGCFFKYVEAKHFFKKANGYGLQYDAFCQFEDRGIKEIKIKERATGNIWKSKPNAWFENGKVMDFGRGKQIFLSLKYMKFEKGEPQMEVPVPTPEEQLAAKQTLGEAWKQAKERLK